MTTTLIMASAIYTPSSYLSSSTIRKSNYSPTLFSTSIALNPNAPNFSSSTLIPLLGFPHFSPWSGLKYLGISISRQSVKPESKEKCKGRVCASLFGVGAPEALVIGVVALLVFGPKGLAEVARNLGKTLREFQPTIRELQEVSNEFKSTLEREIGLDDIQSPKKDTLNSNTAKSTPRPAAISIPDSRITDESNGSPSQDKAYSTEDYLKITEEQLEATAAQQQEKEQTASLTETQVESLTQPQDGLPSESKVYSSEDYLKITEEQLKATATQQQPKEQTASLGETQSESLTQPQVLVSDAVQEAAAVMPTTQKPESET